MKSFLQEGRILKNLGFKISLKTCPVCKFDKMYPFQDENRTLVERLIRYKSKDADKMNEENENFVRYDYITFMLFL
jgi:hypothetical protein